MNVNLEEVKKQFAFNGFAHVPQFKNESWARYWRSQLLSIVPRRLLKSASPFKWNNSGFISRYSQFWELLVDSELLQLVRVALDLDDVRFAIESDAKIWSKQLASGWHRDGLEQQFGTGTDWTEFETPYKIARVAVYLPTPNALFSWGCIPGSHKSECLISQYEEEEMRKQFDDSIPCIKSRLGYIDSIGGRLPIRVTGTAAGAIAHHQWISISPGDILVFDPRLIHAGGDVPFLKYALFFSFGASNSHTFAYASRARLQAEALEHHSFNEMLIANGLQLSE